MTTETPEVMDLGYEGQQAFCAALRLIPPHDVKAWLASPDARRVSELLEEMNTQQDKIRDTARWIRQALDRVDERFAGGPVRTVNMNECGEIGRYAGEYDMAVAAYMALQKRLAREVGLIRAAQGYEAGAFSRLEDHPAMSPAGAALARALADAEDHVARFPRQARFAARRHLAGEHGIRPDRAGTLMNTLHEQAHADDLAALRARVAAIPAE